jgi:hypothetical protein
MKHAVVYIPGLGDHRNGQIQDFFFSFWKTYGIKPVYHPMNWSDRQPLSIKLEGILADIDKLLNEGYTVSLMSASAGASVAINAYALRQESIHKVICVCGKLANPQTITNSYFRSSPAFKDSMIELSKSLASLNTAARNKILSLRPIADPTVPTKDTIIEGFQTGVMPSVGHGFSILFALSLGSPRIVKFIKD